MTSSRSADGPLLVVQRLTRSWTGVIGLGASLFPAIVGLAVSAMLAVDYRRAVPVFCSEGGGCEAVKRSIFAAFFGVPTPLFGVGAFAAIGLAALLPGRGARIAQVVLSSAAGVIGVLLVFAQAMLGRFCPYCCAADASGIACAAVSSWRLLGAPEATPPLFSCAVGALLLAAAGVVPLLLGARASGVPAVIRAEEAATPRGEVTIVDFVDFECPFCRQAQAELEPLVLAHEGRVRLLRRQVPLHIHPHSRDAARAACCAERFGKGEAMADALFSAPIDRLAPAGCEEIARGLGIEIEPFRACVADPRTDARIDADRAEFKAAGGEALPTMWIGARELVGLQPPEAVQRAFAEALAGAGG